MGFFEKQREKEKQKIEKKQEKARYEELENINEATRRQIREHLVDGEEFVVAFETKDNPLMDTEGSPVVVTDRRVIDITSLDERWLTFSLSAISGIHVGGGGRKIQFLGVGSDENTDVSVKFARNLGALGDEFARAVQQQMYKRE